MTLKEKLQEEQPYINAYSFKLTKESVEKFEKIADDYVIEFTEWMYKYKADKNGIRELLEIFKKEKDYESNR